MLVTRIFSRNIAFCDPGIVDQDIDATVLCGDGLRNLVHVCRVPDIQHDTFSLNAKRAQPVDHSRDTLGKDLCHNDRGARFAEGLRTSGANSLPAASYNCHAAI
jgi:hypothetical protein